MRDDITFELDRRVLEDARELAARRGVALDRLVEELLRTAVDRSRMSSPRTETIPRTERPTTGVKRWSRTDLRRRGLEVGR